MVDMPKTATKFYKSWLSAFPESWSSQDLERFYMFVSVLLVNSRKLRSGYWLKENLKKDCPKLSESDIEKYTEIYNHIKNFKGVWKSQQAQLLAKEEFEERMRKAKEKYG